MSPHYQEGTYLCNVLEQRMSVAKTGTPQFMIKFKPVFMRNFEVPKGDENEWLPLQSICYDRKMFMYITDKTIDFVVKKLKTLNLLPPDGDWGKLDQDREQFVSIIGDKKEFFCQYQEKDGMIKEKWDVSNNSEGSQIQSIEDKDMMNLNAMFGDALRNAAADAPSTDKQPAQAEPKTNNAPPGYEPPKQAQAPRPQTEANNDLPF